MNITKNFLRKLILEQVDELFSDESEERQGTQISRDSADDQIDSFIIKFEKDSILSDDDSLAESLESLSLSAFLSEQDEPGAEEEEDAEDEQPAENLDAPEDEEVEDPPPASSGDLNDVEPEPVPKLPLDVDAFTKRVARLAMNSDKILDIKSIIINRAMKFLRENYDEDHVSAMKETLDTQFDFDLDGTSQIPLAPFAIGANPAGAGISGGGG